MYRILEDVEAQCTVCWILIPGLLLILCTVFCALQSRLCRGRRQDYEVVTADTTSSVVWLNNEVCKADVKPSPQSDCDTPSEMKPAISGGVFEGRRFNYETKDSEPLSPFSMEINAEDGTCSGYGESEAGYYTLSGKCIGERVLLTQQYEVGSEDPNLKPDEMMEIRLGRQKIPKRLRISQGIPTFGLVGKWYKKCHRGNQVSGDIVFWELRTPMAIV
mmetsp:Transcript_43179/g.69254  ORF Transcript_43179/g.69254 Transcript_43179/m.69254 type:complete len:218 (-) Transcript_43179:41-694(-)